MNKHKKNVPIAREFTRQLVSKFSDKLEKVILFGSRAKGTARADSDYDLLLVMQRKNHRVIDGIYGLVVDFEMDRPVDISLKIYTKGEFQKGMALPTPFMEEISETGITLWNNQKSS